MLLSTKKMIIKLVAFIVIIMLYSFHTFTQTKTNDKEKKAVDTRSLSNSSKQDSIKIVGNKSKPLPSIDYSKLIRLPAGVFIDPGGFLFYEPTRYNYLFEGLPYNLPGIFLK